ncbi:MAG: flavin reductase family protein [Burkholderiaceae bacterium]|nr:flavin reductase family protein [Burkholderiaceae bacterium]
MPTTTAPTLPVATPMGFGQREFRDALGMFATGVTVVTTLNPAGQPVGLTASSFNSVSLSPPLVLWSLAHGASTMAAFRACSHYAIHVLAADQLALANRFAQRGIDRFAGVEHRAGHSGAPLLADALAVFECRNRSQHDEGDHLIFVGEVVHCHPLRSAAPLLYHRGHLLPGQLAPLPEPAVAQPAH